MLLLFGLTTLAFFAATSVGARMAYKSRAEVLLFVLIAANALLLLPIHVLGLTHALTRGSLALFSALLSLGTFAASSQKEPLHHGIRTLRLSTSLLRLPADALMETARARSVACVGVLAALAALLWTAWLSYLAPSDSWDGAWYHEVMIGYAIQNKGYAPIALPWTLMQQANGYPRNCEMTSVFFVLLGGRNFLELPQSIFGAPLVLATYLLVHRFSKDRISSMGFGAGILLVPGALLELRSTYIDLHAAALLAAAIYFSLRSPMRLRDAWAASLSLSLLIGSKSVALLFTPPLALFALFLAVLHNRHQGRKLVATLLGAFVLLAAAFSVTYVRNYLAFKNPIWPIRYENPRFHIAWPGVHALSDMQWNRPLSEVWREITSPPVPGKDFADTRVYGYGLATPFVLVPLGLLGLFVLFFRTLREAMARWLERPRDPLVWPALVLTAFMLTTAVKSPALWQARYNIHLILGLMVLVAYLARGFPRLAEGISTTVILTNFISYFWVDPGWGFTWKSALAFAELPAHERDAQYPAGWSMEPHVARARDRELTSGTVVVFSDDCTFPGMLWNKHYDNRLLFVEGNLSREDALRALDKVQANWVVAGPSNVFYQAADSAKEGWERIGLASRGFPNTAFRRVPTSPKSL